MLERVNIRMKKLNLCLNFSEDAIEFLMEKGFDPQYGARLLARVIQKYLEDPLADEMLKNSVLIGSEIREVVVSCSKDDRKLLLKI
jgi:ATP-dependent Clp protease ATP-binding subunit ClpC